MTKGQRIKSLREKINMTQTEMAEKIDVSKQTLYKYENDIITNIPSDKIEAIAKITGSTPSFIMGWTNATKTKNGRLILMYNPPSETEEIIMSVCQRLNREGQEKVLEYARMLDALGTYAEDAILKREKEE